MRTYGIEVINGAACRTDPGSRGGGTTRCGDWLAAQVPSRQQTPVRASRTAAGASEGENQRADRCGGISLSPRDVVQQELDEYGARGFD